MAGRQQSWMRYGECSGHQRGLRPGLRLVETTSRRGEPTVSLERARRKGSRPRGRENSWQWGASAHASQRVLHSAFEGGKHE